MLYKEILAKVKDLPVMIIGDVMMDVYLFGSVSRISPEAPVPVVDIRSRENRLGGAANVALNLASLGAKPILCSVVGNDLKGDEFFQLLKEDKMMNSGIFRSDKRPTTTKFRVIGNQVQLLRVDEETTEPLSTEDEQKFIRLISTLIEYEKPAAILFQDYDKGSITPNVIKAVTEIANAKNIPTTVDPKKRNFRDYKNVTLFKPNLKELKEGLGIDLKEVTEESLKNAVEELHTKQNVDMVMVTLSEKGAFISNKSENLSYLAPAHIRTIADVSGAGDTVISVATICLALGIDPRDLVEYSNLAGGIVCESVGVVPIDRKRFFKEMEIIQRKRK
ncbi:PfkB family carbohydrate kinase [Bacteroidales bacterium OttesenSCG-928-C19]|nr:PfkB family carbohydrate kinase [Bacteroidales bacterium OttesenSCG-928-C19]